MLLPPSINSSVPLSQEKTRATHNLSHFLVQELDISSPILAQCAYTDQMKASPMTNNISIHLTFFLDFSQPTLNI
jgi:hypothetical protein